MHTCIHPHITYMPAIPKPYQMISNYTLYIHLYMCMSMYIHPSHNIKIFILVSTDMHTPTYSTAYTHIFHCIHPHMSHMPAIPKPYHMMSNNTSICTRACLYTSTRAITYICIYMYTHTCIHPNMSKHAELKHTYIYVYMYTPES